MSDKVKEILKTVGVGILTLVSGILLIGAIFNFSIVFALINAGGLYFGIRYLKKQFDGGGYLAFLTRISPGCPIIS